MTTTAQHEDLAPIRESVRALCADFPGEYWRRLDRERPLWECYLIEGLADDRWAVLTKIHHCIADGIATTQMLARFSDDRDERESFATDIRAAREPERPGPSLPKFGLNPLSWVNGLGRSALAAAATAEQVAVGAAELTASLFSPAPASSLPKSPPLPPPPERSSMVSCELKPCSTTSVE